MTQRKRIYCCECKRCVKARLTDGSEIYPHRVDLGKLPFWKCDKCGNHVGCHHKTETPTQPLGVIANKEIRDVRQHLHALIDPIWKGGYLTRKELYRRIGQTLGYEFHVAEIRTVEEGHEVWRAVKAIIDNITKG